MSGGEVVLFALLQKSGRHLTVTGSPLENLKPGQNESGEVKEKPGFSPGSLT